MPQLKIKILDKDTEGETLYQSKEIKLGSRGFETPLMTLDTALLRKDENLSPIVKGYNEIYKRVGTRQTPLEILIRDLDKQEEFNSRINTQLNKINPDVELTSCYIEYVGYNYPSGPELEFILDTSYCYSDLVPLPIIHSITKNIKNDSEFGKYLDFIKSSITFLESFNKKPIIGMVPRLAYKYITELIEFYVSYDVKLYSVDLACRSVTTLRQPLLACFRKLNEYGLVEEGFISAINTSPGRFIKDNYVINSKDILCYGFGFDTIARRHRPLRMPKEIWEKIDRSSSKLRLFNKEDYGYYKIFGLSDVDEIYQFDSSIPRKVFSVPLLTKRYIIRRFENIYNTEQIGFEAFRIRNILRDYIPKEYISQKTHVKKQDIKKITKFKRDFDRINLSKWFN